MVRATDVVGKWKIDEEATKAEMGWNVFERVGLALYKDMQLEFTPTKVKVQLSMLGESKEFEGNYRVLGAEGQEITIEATTGPEQGQKSRVTFLRPDQIRLEKEDRKGDASRLVLQRIR
ncbi:MAG: hypothetical protein HS115_12585 [Spirochaetales bacterium]|nr:hypothetical protein [Spirochaetales bacterium]